MRSNSNRPISVLVAPSTERQLVFATYSINTQTDSKVHGANTGPTWGEHDPGEPHVGFMNLAIWALDQFTPVTNQIWLLQYVACV